MTYSSTVILQSFENTFGAQRQQPFLLTVPRRMDVHSSASKQGSSSMCMRHGTLGNDVDEKNCRYFVFFAHKN